MTSQTFIDSNIIVYAYTASPKTKAARSFLRKGTFTDSLVLIESFSKLRTIHRNHQDAQEIIRIVMSSLQVVPVTQDTIFEAMKITDLDVFDAIHAVSAKNGAMITADKQLAKYCKTKPAV